MTTYADIIERLQKANGHDRQIDIAIGKLLPPSQIQSDGSWQEEDDTVRFPIVTASIDASIALVGRILRTYSLRMTDDPSGQGAILFYWPGGLSGEEQRGPFTGFSSSLSTAILLALFTALQQSEQP